MWSAADPDRRATTPVRVRRARPCGRFRRRERWRGPPSRPRPRPWWRAASWLASRRGRPACGRLLLGASGLLLRAGGLLLRRLPGALGRAAGLPLAQQLDRLFEVHGLRVGAARDRRVQRPVGHVGPVPAVEHAHGRAGVGMLAQLGDGRLGPPAVLLGLGEQGLRPLDGDREDLVLGLEAAALLALLQVGAVATVVGGDLVTLGVGAHLPR